MTTETDVYTFDDFISDHPEIVLSGNEPKARYTFKELLKLIRVKDSKPVQYYLTLTNTKTDKSFSFAYHMGIGLLEKYSHMSGGYSDRKQIYKSTQLPFYARKSYDLEKWAGLTNSSGIGPTKIRLKAPTLFDAIYCMQCDADVINYDLFEDWAENFGYDSDSRKAETVYRLIPHYCPFSDGRILAMKTKLDTLTLISCALFLMACLILFGEF